VLSEELKFDYLIRFRGNIMVTAVALVQGGRQGGTCLPFHRALRDAN
jgi:hypothetical protein